MGENLIITKRNGNRVPLQSRHMATAVTSARQTWVLNGDDTVDITVQSPYRQTYDIGDKITVFGRDYTLNRLSKSKKSGAHEFQYTLQFEGVQYDLLRATYDVTIDTTNNNLQDVQGDSLTGNLHRFLTVLIANANRVFPGKWRLGSCPETASDVTLTFGESDNCLSVLQSLMGKFGESLFFDIAVDGSVYVLNILSASRTLPFTLEFGKNQGLYMISRDNVSSANIVTRLKVYGSASNITSKYRADRLCLPGKTKAQSYIEKPEAVAKYGIFEGRKHFDNIKPTFTGHVQAVGDSVLELIDPTISFDLNAKEADGVTTKYLLNGVAAKVHFNTGNLAGYEFEIAKYDHATHKITLRKFTDDRGDVFPSETSAAFQFATGNEYKIVDITLPPELISAAENELLETGTKYYDQNSQPKVQYSVSVTKAYIEKHFATDAGIVNVFVPGDYVPIKDPDIDVDKAIRIKSITRNVLDPYEYNLTISDTVTSNITNRVISDIIDIDKVLEVNNLKDPARARANWRSSREVLDMVFDPEGDYYTDKIKPNSIDTLALSVGAKSMQFGLSNTIFMPNYNGNVNTLKWKGGLLSHYAISDDGVKSWIIQDGQITLNDSSKPYYIYAKCNRNGENGTFDITTVQHKVEESTEFYYFWIGIVNSVDSETNVRTLSLMYGFTTISGRYIKTGRIESSGDSGSFFDLDSNEFALGDSLIFNRNQDGRLVLNGVFVQNQGGAESPLPCYRGEWNVNTAYFIGDTVRYAVDGKFSLFGCIRACQGIVPTDSTCWEIQASAGDNPVVLYCGEYSSLKTYYGTASRLDCVKYQGAYYITRIGAGTFSDVLPTDTSKWKYFGASFENVATGLLLAENANIANLIFRNQRLESSAKTNGKPNFFLDGLKNIASFAAGNVVFDGDSANIGWLRVAGQDLLGFDNNGVRCLRITPEELPNVDSSLSSADLVIKSCGGDATFTGSTDYEISFEQDVHCYLSPDGSEYDVALDFNGWVEVDIPEDYTLLDFTSYYSDCFVKPSNSNNNNSLNHSISANVQRKVGSSWENIGSISLNTRTPQITVPRAGRIRITISGSVTEIPNYNFTGKFSFGLQGLPAITTKAEMIIAKDGFMAIFNSNYMRMHSTDGLVVKFGNTHFRINSSGIAKSTNGSSWTNL